MKIRFQPYLPEICRVAERRKKLPIQDGRKIDLPNKPILERETECMLSHKFELPDKMNFVSVAH